MSGVSPAAEKRIDHLLDHWSEVEAAALIHWCQRSQLAAPIYAQRYNESRKILQMSESTSRQKPLPHPGTQAHRRPPLSEQRRGSGTAAPAVRRASQQTPTLSPIRPSSAQRAADLSLNSYSTTA